MVVAKKVLAKFVASVMREKKEQTRPFFGLFPICRVIQHQHIIVRTRVVL